MAQEPISDVNEAVPPPLDRDEVSILSPLRYPGSKRRLAGYIERALQDHNLRPSLYVEPFAGGASVALQLLNDNVVQRILLADLDPLVASLWDVVFNDTEWLIEQVNTVEVTVDRWREFKAAIPTDKRQRALACLFLNRTSFSGILAPTVGPLGGWGQTSAYPISCRFPRKTLEKRIRQAAALGDRVGGVWNTSWEDTIACASTEYGGATERVPLFFYLDPPFFLKADKLYTHFFKHEDHVRFRDAILQLEHPWILSYDVAPQIHELYNGSTHGRANVEVLYSTSSSPGSQPVKEVILTNLPFLPDHTRLWRRSNEWSIPKGTGNGNGNGKHSAVAPNNEPPVQQPAMPHTPNPHISNSVIRIAE